MFWTPRANPKFAIAIMPNTQIEVGVGSSSKDDKRFGNRAQWLADGRYTLTLRYVLHSGDVTDWGERDASQLDVADAAAKQLEQVKLPYLFSVGNHNTNAVCVGGSDCGAGSRTWEAVRQFPKFNQYFKGRFNNGNLAGQFAADDLSKVYSTFEAGGFTQAMQRVA